MSTPPLSPLPPTEQSTPSPVRAHEHASVGRPLRLCQKRGEVFVPDVPPYGRVVGQHVHHAVHPPVEEILHVAARLDLREGRGGEMVDETGE